MDEKMIKRIYNMAFEILDTRSTIREIGKRFGVSKSTVHKDLTDRLEEIDKDLYLQVRKLLDYNKSIRHIRGGLSTKRKYSNKKATLT